MSLENLSLVPKHTIEYGQYLNPDSVLSFFRDRCITKYIYCIKYKGIVLKYGMSCPKSGRTYPGERVYRQLAHCYSWGEARIRGSSGADWIYIEEDFKKLYGTDIDHKDITVVVWDFSNFEFMSYRPALEIKKIESSLIEQYTKLVGERPIGNLENEVYNKNRGFVATSHFESLYQPQEYYK